MQKTPEKREGKMFLLFKGWEGINPGKTKNSLSNHFMQYSPTEKMKILTSLINLNFCEDIRKKVATDLKREGSQIQKLEVEHEVIQKSIDDLSGSMTVIIIAHRLSTVKNVDCVLGNSSSGLLEAPSLQVPTINLLGFKS